jgi:hypothetical protein
MPPAMVAAIYALIVDRPAMLFHRFWCKCGHEDVRGMNTLCCLQALSTLSQIADTATP